MSSRNKQITRRNFKTKKQQRADGKAFGSLDGNGQYLHWIKRIVREQQDSPRVQAWLEKTKLDI